MSDKLSNDDPPGIYLADRGRKTDLVMCWDGRRLRMANFPNPHAPGLPLNFFSNFRPLVEPAEVLRQTKGAKKRS